MGLGFEPRSAWLRIPSAVPVSPSGHSRLGRSSLRHSRKLRGALKALHVEPHPQRPFNGPQVRPHHQMEQSPGDRNEPPREKPGLPRAAPAKVGATAYAPCPLTPRQWVDSFTENSHVHVARAEAPVLALTCLTDETQNCVPDNMAAGPAHPDSVPICKTHTPTCRRRVEVWRGHRITAPCVLQSS